MNIVEVRRKAVDELNELQIKDFKKEFKKANLRDLFRKMKPCVMHRDGNVVEQGFTTAETVADGSSDFWRDRIYFLGKMKISSGVIWNGEKFDKAFDEAFIPKLTIFDEMFNYLPNYDREGLAEEDTAPLTRKERSLIRDFIYSFKYFRAKQGKSENDFLVDVLR